MRLIEDAFIDQLLAAIDNGERPTEFPGLSVEYRPDHEVHEMYAFVEARLRNDDRVYAEIEGETYGQLVGIRIYTGIDTRAWED